MEETSGGNIVLYTYGERPITELFVTFADNDDFYDLIKRIELADAEKVPFNDEERIESIFLEAPSGGPIGYVDFVIMTTSFCFFFEVKPDMFVNVQERLKEQIPRYYHCITDPTTRSSQELVKKLYMSKFKKRAYLISITGDEEYPADLDGILCKIPNINYSLVGWAPYSLLRSVFDRKGVQVKGVSPHIWAEWKR